MNPVRVEQGLLRGAANADGTVVAFKGIPYARPPVGALRWRAPEPPASWAGERDATSFGPACVQPERPENAITFLGHERQSEDCLYLNVWTGATSPSDKRPVIVWIHFGAFLMGSGAGFINDGEALAKAGVVLVTLNHRLGRFGFFAHPELTAEAPYGASGNYGLLDQIAALRWVQRNIAGFGGDPECVTFAGQSSGSSSVSLLLASPLAEGLFQRAIAQSGAEFTPPRRNIGWPALSSLADAEQDGAMIAESLAAPSLAALRATPAAEILGALARRGPVNWRQGVTNTAFIGAYPIVDGHVIPEAGMRATFEAGRQNKVPLLTGSAANEGGGKTGARDLASFRAEARERYGAMAEAFFAVFPATNDAEARAASSAVIGDLLFAWQNWTLANLHARSSGRAVHYYHFAQVPAFPPGARFAEADGDATQELGAMHGMDVPYVFRNLHKRDWPWRPADRRLSEIMSSYWLNFAKTGDPNGPGLAAWPRFEEAARPTMIFSAEPHLGAPVYEDRFRFWTKFFTAQ